MCAGRKLAVVAGLLWLATLAGLAGGAAPAGAAAEVTFASQVRLGNVFTAGEAVQIEAGIATAASVDWTVTDFEGHTVDSGTAAVSDHRVRISPRTTATGFYSVRFTSRAGGEGTTTFAIVPAVDITKMPDSRFAVMTHFNKGMPVDVMPLIAKAGIASVRDEVEWNGFERKKGEFVTPATVEAYMPKLAESGIEPLVVLAFGNRNHYAGGAKIPEYKAAPYDAAGYEAYTNYALEVLKRFASQVKTVEIWNEYNGTFCDGPAAKNRPKYYTEMLRHAYAAIKRAHPQVKVVGGALVKIPMPYIEKLLKEGALAHMDAIAVHPYRGVPEGVEKELAALVELMKKYNGGVAKPIWVTETGSWRDSTPERATTAEYLVRMMTLMLTQPQVERIYWYLLCDFHEFKTMGILHGADDPSGRFTPTMIYPAYANLVHQLYGAEFGAREATDSRTRLYRFHRGEEVIWVAWSTSGTARIDVTTRAPIVRVNLVGGEERLSPVDGRVAAEVGSRPCYFIARRGAAMSERPRPNEIVADSIDDFSSTQGARNWSYYYYASDGKGAAPYDPARVMPMKWEASRGDWDDLWQGPAPYLCMGEGGAESSAKDGRQMWAVRRWVSGVEGPAAIAVEVGSSAGQGDGVLCRVYLDGKEIARQHVVAGAKEQLVLPVVLKKGALVDCAITPGDGTDSAYDAVAFRATVLKAR